MYIKEAFRRYSFFNRTKVLYFSYPIFVNHFNKIVVKESYFLKMSNFQSPTLPAVNVNQQNPLKMKTRAINLNSFEKLCYILASSPTLKRSQERKGAARGSNQMPRPTGKNACDSHSYNGAFFNHLYETR